MRLRSTLGACLASLLAVATASSSARDPLQRIGLAKNADILTPNHRVTALSSFDLAFDFTTTSQRIRLSLEPNHDLFPDGAKISYLDADGQVHAEEPVDRLQHKIYKGTAWLKRGARWDRAGWARIDVRRDGLDPVFEGTFTIDHDHHHVLVGENYVSTMVRGDPELDLGSGEEKMVVFRDSDMGRVEEHSELRRRDAGPACVSDELKFNTHEDHPVYAAMRARSAEENFFAMPFSAMLGKRQSDIPGGGNGAGVNLVSSIGSTAGCPTTRKVALVGVATDCTYIKAFSSDKTKTRDNIIKQMNSASELFESTFNISLGLANVVITDPSCPTTEQTATPWNQDCSASVDIQKRLNLFSAWRGGQNDGFSHWTLLSTCNTGSAVGLAWLGQACVAGSQANGGQNETVSGANVVIRTSTEWQVIAHETGHTFGAVHDCTSDTCQNQNAVSASQCCPLSASTCDAGEQFIMNPSTAQGITRFSACSIGNICSALGRTSVKSTCLSNNRNVNLTTTQTCGNGIVEGDEQCDCGGESCGDNACCDASTCKFKSNAVCDDSNEDCCRGCQFASASTVCRASNGQCDPQEKCTGDSPYCPEDKTQPDGTDCGGGLKCASGQCTSRDQQCKTIMGSYTQGNDTYACDNSNCMLSCASPEFGNTCYGLQQNFLDGTSCVGGGKCQNGQCTGGSVGNEVKDWILTHKPLVIGLAAGIGGLILLSILGCCWRCVKRRRLQKKYAAGPPVAPYYAGGPGGRSGSGGSRSRSRGGPSGAMQQVPPPPPTWAPQTAPQWAPQTGHAPHGAAGGPVPPPPLFRSGSVRYA
ncbi:hypothetical protein DPSP01_010345 [Paraphaeosphaeria sporulosa]|uniref:Disintegrin and metalloproteinase domain-containing protein B n=1 Tax=Paraphaeosphaeria sporulosa TaxID=1460663 RepID=A0A177CEV3_9PLEO|nr:uncharacterized protein CC84DRAFT_1165609 [Paraphaeosphaeria sporulosa]OAG05328.1 hypothetical protein CC84DRAFT_1165609 [Paraphaeosphaeria sporulosa]